MRLRGCMAVAGALAAVVAVSGAGRAAPVERISAAEEFKEKVGSLAQLAAAGAADEEQAAAGGAEDAGADGDGDEPPALSPDLVQGEAPVFAVPPVEIIGTTPLLGTGIEKEKVPSNVQSFGAETVDEAKPLHLGDLLNRRAGSVTINEAQNNPFQPDVQFRGFTASPLLGNPQGIAVYQNGVRINEPFGDVVQWDVIPEFAVDSVQVLPGSNPVFGLNALGGSLALGMKNGFTYEGANVEAYGGSFGRWQTTGEYGAQVDGWGFYTGVTGFEEDGWRDKSPSDLQQVYSDARYRSDRAEAGVNFTYANTNLTGNGPLPLELLAMDRESIFTFPDITENELFFGSAQGDFAATDTVSFQGNLYFRRISRDTVNGDEGELEDCTGIDGPPGTLCEDAGTADEEQVTDFGGNPIPTSAGGDGALNTSGTNVSGFGASIQTTIEEEVFGKPNHFVAGFSIDYADVEFHNKSEVGALTAERGVDGSGIFLGGDEANTRLDSTNRYIGLFFTDTLSVTDRLDVTVAGRWNSARVDLKDQLGIDLTSNNQFNRFNPAVGLTYAVADNATAFANYAEANRAPSAAELGCSDPAKPCRVPNAFLADPPLDDVVSRSVEVGMRGNVRPLEGEPPVNWSVAGFGSRNFNDIIFVGSGTPIGAGFFQNAGITQRLGVEVGLDGRVGSVGWYANYTFIDATFESNLFIASPGHPNADADGLIHARPGDRIPGIPQHTGKVGVGVNVTDEWFIALESIINSSQVLRGDEANLLDEVGGYAVVNLNSTYRIAQFGNPGRLEAFLKVNNLFDRDYETFGLVGEDPSEVLGPGFSNPLFLSPGAPLGVWGGLRLVF